ncbi:MAG: DNA replication and repair protein RecF [Acidobacteriota bacterium]
MLEAIEVRGFRNLQPASLALGAGGSLILGPNGAGKTSLLEAVYLLATTRSFRTPRIADCVRRPAADSEERMPTALGGDGFRLCGETSSRQSLELTYYEGQRHQRLNGDRAPLAEYLAAQPVIAWTAQDAEMLTGAPQLRRRFLDRGLIGLQPASIDVISRYRQALGEKRKLLQRGCSTDELVPWNLVLASAAAVLIRRRADYVETLKRSFLEVSGLCRLGLPEIEIRYRPSPREGLQGADAIAKRLEEEEGREMAAERPFYGPHRDDLSIRWLGRPVREMASAGERKALGLLLIAAHGLALEAVGVEPIYLLDDVDTELDAKRLAGLWRHFGSAGQLLASSNRPHVFKDLPMQHRLDAERGVFEAAT